MTDRLIRSNRVCDWTRMRYPLWITYTEIEMRPRRPPTDRKQGQHASTHPWKAAWNGYSPYVTGDVLPDRERYGLGPGRACRTLADMTPDEIAAIEREYGAKVLPRKDLPR